MPDFHYPTIREAVQEPKLGFSPKRIFFFAPQESNDIDPRFLLELETALIQKPDLKAKIIVPSHFGDEAYNRLCALDRVEVRKIEDLSDKELLNRIKDGFSIIHTEICIIRGKHKKSDDSDDPFTYLEHMQWDGTDTRSQGYREVSYYLGVFQELWNHAKTVEYLNSI